MIEYQVDASGIAILTWNLPQRPVNVINDESLEEFSHLIERALTDNAVKGIVVTSAKRDFIVGADLASLLSDPRADVLWQKSRVTQSVLRRLESGGKPVCAAINGSALGGGLEIALACHHRVISDRPTTQLGFPEVTLGLLPGAGGTQRLPRLIGAGTALPLLLEGRLIEVSEAQALGLVDSVVPEHLLLQAALVWAAGPEASSQQPWDRKGFVPPGGRLDYNAEFNLFALGTAGLTARAPSQPQAPRHILSSVFEGYNTDIDTGLKSEARHFVACARSDESRNMVRTMFFGKSQVGKLMSRPPAIPSLSLKNVGVVGAGMMGKGIAQVCADRGLKVTLIDVSMKNLDAAVNAIGASLRSKVGRRGYTAEMAEASLARISTGTNLSLLSNAELVIEAVFEDRKVKGEVLRAAEISLPAEAIWGSNTSSLPISQLARTSARPGQFVGIHFFSPVERMPLVEIIRGEATSDATLAHAMDFAQMLGKIPIVVNDARGFYTTRVFMSYLSEAIAMVGEGIAPALIENAAKQAGMPVGPLALTDEVSFDLLNDLLHQAHEDGVKTDHLSSRVISTFHDDLKRRGRKSGGGFYDYLDNGVKRLWPRLRDVFPPAAQQPQVDEVKKRLLYIQSVETVRCLQEGVICEPIEADLGAVLGWGFPAFLGGPFGLIDTIGAEEFADACRDLAGRHGDHFAPPALLLQRAAEGRKFHQA